jgi:LmbE family N-acetylglucosaminyl deacetylase
MKIVVFAPHPDDELGGAGGSILKWMEEGHEVHIIYISDGRAAYTFERKMGRLVETEETQISEDELVAIRMKEIDEVIEYLNFPRQNIHKFMLPDQDVKNHINEGIEKSKEIIKNADRIVLPSNNNVHEDHQATYDIAVGAVKELGLKEMKFYSYVLYVRNETPKEKQVFIDIVPYRDKVYEALGKYKSQLYITTVDMYYKLIPRKRKERFGVYSFGDIGKYYNF